MIDVTNPPAPLKPMVPNNAQFPGNTEAFNAILAYPGDNDIFLPEGNYYLNTPPDPIKKRTVLRGNSFSGSVLVRNYQCSGQFEPFIKLIDGPGSRIENLSINTVTLDNDGRLSTTGVALLLESQPHVLDPDTGELLKYGTSPDFTTIQNVSISQYGPPDPATEKRLGNWSIALWLNGEERKPPNLIGLRALNITNVFLFASTQACLEMNSLHDAHILASCYPAGDGQGQTTTNLVRINAGETPSNNIISRFKTPTFIKVTNTENSIFMAPTFDKTVINSTNVKFL